MNRWQIIETAPEGVEIMTKIDGDRFGERNVQSLVKKRTGSGGNHLWFYPDMSMYVYYQPTHWKQMPESGS